MSAYRWQMKSSNGEGQRLRLAFSRLRSFHMLQLKVVEVCDGIGFSP